MFNNNLQQMLDTFLNSSYCMGHYPLMPLNSGCPSLKVQYHHFCYISVPNFSSINLQTSGQYSCPEYKSHAALTLTGGFLVMCETRKFIAMSSQFMYSSTLSLTACGSQYE